MHVETIFTVHKLPGNKTQKSVIGSTSTMIHLSGVRPSTSHWNITNEVLFSQSPVQSLAPNVKIVPNNPNKALLSKIFLNEILDSSY
jgi:hypothetical protein